MGPCRNPRGFRNLAAKILVPWGQWLDSQCLWMRGHANGRLSAHHLGDQAANQRDDPK